MHRNTPTILSTTISCIIYFPHFQQSKSCTRMVTHSFPVYQYLETIILLSHWLKLFFFFKKVPIKHQKTVYVCVSACFIVLRNAEFLTFNSPMCNRWEYLSRISIYHCNNSSWIGLCTPTFWRAGDVIFAHFIYPGALSHVHKHGHFRMIFFFPADLICFQHLSRIVRPLSL